ncbi:MAG: heme-binding domain-containing protein [Terriglobales bacterium]
MRAVGKRVALAGLVVFLAVQAIPVDRRNSPVDSSRTIFASEAMPLNVAGVLRRSCQDCHSNETHWPWYSYVAPMSWIVATDVHKARRQMNFSEWAGYSEKKREERLNGICEQVVNGDMPEGKYALIHRRARVSEDERHAVCQWVEGAQR